MTSGAATVSICIQMNYISTNVVAQQHDDRENWPPLVGHWTKIPTAKHFGIECCVVVDIIWRTQERICQIDPLFLLLVGHSIGRNGSPSHHRVIYSFIGVSQVLFYKMSPFSQLETRSRLFLSTCGFLSFSDNGLERIWEKMKTFLRSVDLFQMKHGSSWTVVCVARRERERERDSNDVGNISIFKVKVTQTTHFPPLSFLFGFPSAYGQPP